MRAITGRMVGAALLAIAALAKPSHAQSPDIQLGPRPFYLVGRMQEGPLKTMLRQCAPPFRKTDFSIGHRGAPLQFPEHTKESYEAAARMGAGVIECDVTFTKDRQLVCRHAQCDLHTTTDILAIPDLAAKCTQPFSPADPASGRKASAKCCTSDLTLAEFRRLRGKMDAANTGATDVAGYMQGTLPWRTDLYAAGGTLMTHAQSIALIKSLGAKFTPEAKAPEVAMPFDGDYTQEAFLQQIVDDYKAAGVPASDVFPQSFRLSDVRYWLQAEPEFGAQAVFLDDRERKTGFDPSQAATWMPTMPELAATGVKIIGPPIWMLVALDENKSIVPSAYARAARAAGLDIIAWSLERDGPLANGGGWYHQTITPAITGDGDTFTVLDVLARQVGIRGMFSDWPATTTFYASCMGLR